MKVFIIPSWYPTKHFPIAGNFIQEQARLLARHFPDWQIGICLWGSHEPKLWLRVWRPLHALIQYGSKFPIRRYENQLEVNLVEYFHPAYTWTRRFRKGNLKGIVKACEQNLERYILHSGEPDVIHAHVAYPAGKVAQALSERHKIPYIITEHMSPFPLSSFRHDFRRSLLPPLQNADRVLSVGQNLSATLLQHGIQSILTRNFIDLEIFKEADMLHTKPVIVAIGRLTRQKGFDLLLKAMAGLGQGDWLLKIIGAGPEEKNLDRLIRKLRLVGKVQLLGELETRQIAPEIQTSDFFVLPSRHESFGIVLVEAMGCGKPVVYTECGGITGSLPEYVGIRCVAEEGSLLKSIRQMMDQFRSYDGARIREFVKSNYSVAVAGEELKKVYAEVTGNPQF